MMRTVLLWEGKLNNARLRSLFKLEPVQVSRLLAAFARRYRRLVKHDKRQRVYLLREGQGEPLSADGFGAYVSIASSKGPWAEDARLDLTQTSLGIYSILQQACIQGHAVRVKYLSMTRPEGTDRVLFPHTIVRCGRRWHVRAWCVDRQDFRDFTVGRIRAAAQVEALGGKSRADDTDWTTMVDLKLVPHPGLSKPQQEIIKLEFFDGEVQRMLSCRRALAAYLLQDLAVATDLKAHQPPAYQISLANITEVRPHLFPG